MRVNDFSRRRATVLAAVVLFGLTGCGGGADDDAATGPTTAAQETPAEETPAEEAGGDCGAAAAEIKASLTGMGSVTSIDVPTCAKAVVATSLGADEGDLAASLCQNAANEASTHGVASVSVVSAGGTELAAGTDAEDCRPTGK
jgi:hypothetical protein